MEVINLADKFSRFDDRWSPKVIAELNGQAVKLAKVEGTFVWHDHAAEDELFFLFQGELTIELEDREPLHLRPGELCVIPHGVRHRPRTPEGEAAWIMLLEPVGTKHTGDVDHPLTVRTYDRL